MSRKFSQRLLSCFFIYFSVITLSKAYIPSPNKVVIVVLENHAYSQIAGSPHAPYINSLLNDSMTAVFTQSYALIHPSQPNYFQLFAGSTQGVTTNNLPPGTPFTTPNLYSELAAVSKTFIAYSEGLPFAGYTGEASGAYARKHAPWVNWQGTGLNGIPSALHKPFTAFPTNYNNLPDVCFVIPDQNNDMHNGTDPGRIITGDTWVQNNLSGFVQWARTNNSLLIVTFDEDNNVSGNHILTFFTGPMVHKGNYSQNINHYNVLRTIEDFFGTTHAGFAATASPINYCWKCPQPLTISANGPANFCSPPSLVLTAATGSSYLWSNNLTTQSISVDSSGNYKCRIVATSGCISVTSPISVTVNRLPVINSFTASAMAGNIVTINGANFTGSTSVKLNGMSVSYSIVNDGKILFNVPSTATSGFISITNICGTIQTPTQFIVVPAQIQLALKLLIEGYYKGNGSMYPLLSPSETDTILVELRQTTSPYQISFTSKAIIDTSGNTLFNLPGNAWGNQYYITATGRNSLKIWSAAPMTFEENNNYDFTISASQAYGSNQKNLGGGYYGLYSGDINQDEQINFFDIAQLYSTMLMFNSVLLNKDINGDWMVESIDYSMVENNCLPLVTQKP